MTEAGWTAEPKQEGYYWWRKGDELEILHVWECSYLQVSQMQTDEGFGSMSLDSFIREYGGEWLGPLSPTDRQQGRVVGIKAVRRKITDLIDRGFTDYEEDMDDLIEWIDFQLAQQAKGVRDGK